MKKKKILKVATAVATLGVVAAISFSATFAYLTARTAPKANTFASKGVEISIDEGPDWHPEETHLYEPGTSFVKEPKVTVDNASQPAYIAAAVSYWKGVTADEYNANNPSPDTPNDGWAKLDSTSGTKYYKRISNSDFGAIAKTWFDDDNETNPKWTLKSPADTTKYTTYYYKGNEAKLEEIAPNGYTDKLFTKVIFNKDLNAATLPGAGASTSLSDIKIIISAYAVRASSYETPEKAIEELDRLIQNNAVNVRPTDAV